MLVQEIEAPLAVDGMGANKPLDLTAIANTQPGRIGKANLGELISHRLIGRHPVKVTATGDPKDPPNPSKIYL